MNICIGITGEAQHGKGTIADALQQHLATASAIPCARHPLAEPLKEFLVAQFGVREPFFGTGAQKDEPITSLRWADFAWDLVDRAYCCKMCDHRSPNEVTGHPTGRQLMQLFGTEVIRNTWHPKAWLQICRQSVLREWRNGIPVVLVDDVRFPNEADRTVVPITHLIKVVNPSKPKTKASKHSSEKQDIDLFLIDEIILNNGTIEDLQKKVRKWADERLGARTTLLPH